MLKELINFCVLCSLISKLLYGVASTLKLDFKGHLVSAFNIFNKCVVKMYYSYFWIVKLTTIVILLA